MIMGFFSKLFSKNEDNKNCLYAPMAGQVVPVTDVPDPVFPVHRVYVQSPASGAAVCGTCVVQICGNAVYSVADAVFQYGGMPIG